VEPLNLTNGVRQQTQAYATHNLVVLLGQQKKARRHLQVVAWVVSEIRFDLSRG